VYLRDGDRDTVADAQELPQIPGTPDQTAEKLAFRLLA
jgi:hypothetical protein